MPFIRHIAISSNDPPSAAAFYKEHFEMTELFRAPRNTGEKGVWLTDGWIYFAILKYDSDLPKLGPDQKTDFCGIHHIGFMVDDQKTKIQELQQVGIRHVEEPPDAPPHPLMSRPEARQAVNEKIIGPDWVHLDVRDSGWNEVIRKGAQLYELKPIQS